jgi:hypothetical protein
MYQFFARSSFIHTGAHKSQRSKNSPEQTFETSLKSYNMAFCNLFDIIISAWNFVRDDLNDYIQGALPSSFPPESPYFKKDMNNFIHGWRVMKDIVEGLDFVRELGEVHCDLKQSNGMYSDSTVK